MKENKSFLAQLQKEISGEVLSDEYSLGIYSTDASVYQICPLAVVVPRDNNDVNVAIRIAREHQICILPRGAGTSLAGQTVGKSMCLIFQNT